MLYPIAKPLARVIAVNGAKITVPAGIVLLSKLLSLVAPVIVQLVITLSFTKCIA